MLYFKLYTRGPPSVTPINSHTLRSWIETNAISHYFGHYSHWILSQEVCTSLIWHNKMWCNDIDCNKNKLVNGLPTPKSQGETFTSELFKKRILQSAQVGFKPTTGWSRNNEGLVKNSQL